MSRGYEVYWVMKVDSQEYTDTWRIDTGEETFDCYLPKGVDLTLDNVYDVLDTFGCNGSDTVKI